MASIPYTTAGTVILIFVLTALAVRIARLILHRFLDRLDTVSADNRAAIQARAKQLGGALTLLAYGIAALASVSYALSRFGIAESTWNLREIGRLLTTRGINVVIIVAGAWVAMRAANLAIEHLAFKLGRDQTHADPEWQRRASTVGSILTNVVTAAVGFVAILMLLRELTIDVLPILTGAGIAGLAVGFGAQNLVRDVISGFFIILEDQVRIGDQARINGITGNVEQVKLRAIVLRDGEGAVQVFPNGAITALANLSKQFSYAIVDVRIAYSENVDRVIGTMREVGASMERDAVWGPLTMAPLDVVGIESLDGGAATLRVRFKVLPLHQGKVANELRKRLLGALVGRGIHPYAV